MSLYMAGRLPEESPKIEPVKETEAGQYEHVEYECDYPSKKAEAMLSAADILKESGCPSNPEKVLEMEQTDLANLETTLLEEINSLQFDEDTGEKTNANRLTIELLSAYLTLAETAHESKVSTTLLIKNMTRVEF